MIKENYRKNKKVIDNFIWRALQILGKHGVSFLIIFLCARLLTPYDFGIYNYILAVIGFLIIFSDFGISTAVSKYVTEYDTVDQNTLKKVLFNSLLILLICGFAIVLLLILFGPSFLGENYQYVLYALPILFFAPVSSLYDGIFRGLEKFKTLAIVSLIVGALSIFFVYFLVANYGLIGALIAQNLFYVIFVTVLFFVYGNLYFEFDKVLIKRIVSYSLLVGFASIGYFLYTRVDLIMLGYYDYTVETGYYGLINTLFGFSLLFFTIFGSVIAPNNIKLQLAKKIDVLREKVKRFSLYSFVLGFVLSLLLYFIVPVIIKIFLPEYDNISFYAIFYVFLFVIPISVVEATLAHGFITPLGYVSILTKTILFGGVLNIIFNFILLYYFGYIGIIFATIIVHNFINILKLVLFWKAFKE